jgi:hypothetical protein
VNPVVISMLGVAVGLAGFVYAVLRARGADVTADELRQMMQAVVANHDTESGQRIAASIVLRALAAWYTGNYI